MEPRGQRNERRWAEVLDATSHVFGERGYPAASLQEIADRLGIAKGSLYYYARTKEDLLFEILKLAHDHALMLIQEDESTQEMSPSLRLERFIQNWMDGIKRQRFTALSGASSSSRDHWTDFLSEDRRSIVVGERRELNRYLLDLVRDGMAQGEFNSQLDAQHVTSWIFTMMNDTRIWFEADSMVWDDVTAWYIALVTRGLAPSALASAQ
jgi:AcrR family transcriptional regulator